jgi:inosine-uridine nucleoside N-ribohydrolase
MKRISFLIAACLLLCVMAFGQSRKTKVIADQDSAGPQGTNLLSLLMLLRAPQIDLLGITTVSGDQWMEPATVFALWATEQAGRPEVPVIKGAEMPLLNTPREQELREGLYGS